MMQRNVLVVQLLAPLVIVALAIVSEYSGLDMAIARLFFDADTQSWPLKSNFWTAGVLHSGGRDLVVYTMSAVLLFLVATFFLRRIRPYRKGAAYLLLGSLPGPAIVAILKSTTRIYTPWDLEVFGGDKPYLRLFDAAPPDMPAGHGFPGGHSSGGFAFVSAYFLLAAYKSAYRYYGLTLGLVLGFAFAFTQEVRGAHFLSHDLFSLVVCWYAALAVATLMLRRELAQPSFGSSRE